MDIRNNSAIFATKNQALCYNAKPDTRASDSKSVWWSFIIPSFKSFKSDGKDEIIKGVDIIKTITTTEPIIHEFPSEVELVAAGYDHFVVSIKN